MRSFIGTYVFEDLCRDWVLVRAEQGKLGWLPEEYGSYWRQYQKESVQLDIVAISQRTKRILIGEAKWGEHAVGVSVLESLIKRSQRMPQVTKEGWVTDYVLFSRAGFTDAVTRAAALNKTNRIYLVTLDAIEQAYVDLVDAQ